MYASVPSFSTSRFEPEQRPRDLDGHPLYRHGFSPAGHSTYHADLPSRNTESIRQEPHQLLIGFSLDRGAPDPDLERLPMQSRELGLRCARLNVEVEEDTTGYSLERFQRSAPSSISRSRKSRK